jgi:hypothetical protein
MVNSLMSRPKTSPPYLMWGYYTPNGMLQKMITWIRTQHIRTEGTRAMGIRVGECVPANHQLLLDDTNK